MNAALRQAIFDIAIGTPLQGGFFAGAFSIGDTPYGLIVAPKALGDLDDHVWTEDYKDVPGAKSLVDGQANTLALAEAGSELAKRILALDIGGFRDWYLGAQDEVEICYRNLKPTSEENSQWARSGINVSAIPPTYPYSLALPTQTTVETFQSGAAEAFEPVHYWSSTQHAAGSDDAWGQDFDGGNQDGWNKGNKRRARAVRRFAL